MVLYSLTGLNGDGFTPFAAPTWGQNGALYGTTSYGGNSCSLSTIYQLMPPASPGGAWTETVFYAFTAADGANPYTPLSFSPSGAFYGATQSAVFEFVP